MFWQKLSIAPLFYAKIHIDNGGPIAKISCRESKRLDATVFEAFATLDTQATGFNVEHSSLYGNTHGSGTAANKAEAVYRAISEALERWAWFKSVNDPNSSKLLRIDLDSSTSGFAAFPGLLGRSARPGAYLEAAERWCLNAWWEKKLEHRTITNLSSTGVSGLEISTPIRNATVAIIWKDANYGRAYGFAAGENCELAVSKAKVELGRNLHVLEYANVSQVLPATRNERRLLYFSKGLGLEEFDQRALTQLSSTISSPSLVVDCQVPGPWGKYTQVWRCLFNPSGFEDSGGDNYFHF